MRLRDFPLLTDQNIPADVIAFLRAEGFDLIDIQQAGLVSETDANILAWAASQGRIVLTHDADFGTLTVPSGLPFVGMIYLRPGHIRAQSTIDSLQRLFAADPDLTPPFIITVKRTATGVTIRIRQATPR